VGTSGTTDEDAGTGSSAGAGSGGSWAASGASECEATAASAVPWPSTAAARGVVASISVYIERGVPYGRGKGLDVYRRRDLEGGPMVLLWHGRGANGRDVLEPLASALVRKGFAVVVPDWQPGLDDSGRADLLSSLEFTVGRAESLGGDRDRITVAGWSLGASAGADLVLHFHEADGWRPSGFVGLAGGYDAWPVSGRPVGPDADLEPVPCLIVHGLADPVVPVQRSRRFASMLTGRGWPVHFLELDTDHAGVIGTEYEPSMRRCHPSHQASAVAALDATVKKMATLWSTG